MIQLIGMVNWQNATRQSADSKNQFAAIVEAGEYLTV
jgi:hypothetical protein